MPFLYHEKFNQNNFEEKITAQVFRYFFKKRFFVFFGQIFFGDFYVHQLEAAMLVAQIDTVLSRKNLHNKDFERIDLPISFPYKRTMNIKLYRAIINQDESGITVAYVDESISQKFTSMNQRLFFK